MIEPCEPFGTSGGWHVLATLDDQLLKFWLLLTTDTEWSQHAQNNTAACDIDKLVVLLDGELQQSLELDLAVLAVQLLHTDHLTDQVTGKMPIQSPTTHSG